MKRIHRKHMTRKAAALVLALLCAAGSFAACAPAPVGGPDPYVPPVPPDGPVQVVAESDTLPEALRTLTVENPTAVGGIITADSTFTVTTAAETDAATLEKYLRVSPAADFEITGEGNTFTMRPRSALQANTLYRFSLADPEAATLLTPAAFVFQTEDVPRVTGVFPADLSEGADVRTGIEITFSAPLAAGTDFIPYLTIEPALPFRVELYGHGKTLALIPEVKLETGTAYTVSVAAGIPLASGRITETGRIFSFRTQPEESPQSNLSLTPGTREARVRPGESGQIRFSAYRQDRADTVTAKDVKATVYRYADAHAAAAALLDYEANAGRSILAGKEYIPTTDGAKKIGTYTLPVTDETAANTYSRTSSFSAALPALEAGCYLVQYTAWASAGGREETCESFLFLQVTDTDVGSAAVGGDLLLWITEGGQPCADTPVTVHLYDRQPGWHLRAREDGEETVRTAAARTDGEGIATLSTEGRGCALAVIGEGDDSLYVCIGNGTARDTRYRTYVYTDREAYYEDDTIRFWGVITPAEGVNTLRVTSNAAAPVTVEVLPDGTFTGSLTYGDYAGYGVSLSFETPDGAAVASAYKTISREEKPVYTATVEMDRPFYRRGETVTATLTASFFDGTPAEGLRFRYSADGFGSGEVVTDEAGQAVVRLQETSLGARNTDARQIHLYFELIGGDNTYLYTAKNFLYFHSDVVLDTEMTDGGVALSLHHLDTTALTDPSQYYQIKDQLKGAPAEGTVSVLLVRSWSETIVTGTQYDPITKKTVTLTRNEYKEEILTAEGRPFRDGQILLPYVQNPLSGSSYQYRITYPDRARQYTYYMNATPWVSYDYEAPEAYSLTAAREDGQSAGEGRGSFIPGEAVTLTLRLGERIPESGRTLFVYMNADGILAHRLAAGHRDTAVLDGAFMPASRAVALHLTEGEIIAVSYDMYYDYAALNALTAEILPDGDKYLPGGTAEVAVSVRDASGRAVPGASVLLSMVDEASFALRQQQLEADTPLAALVSFARIGSALNARYSVFGYGRYDYLYAGGKKDMASADSMMAMPETAAPSEAESARGDDGSSVYVRENFADNPHFITATTDESGVARFALQIPDNITAWRLSAIASARVGGASPVDVAMGAARDTVICSLPFFVTTTVGDLFLTGDDIALTAHYSGAQDSGTARFTAVLEDSRGTEIARRTAEGIRAQRVSFNFGGVPEGEYSVLVTAAAGGNTDGIRQHFTVVDSAILMPVNRILEIGDVGGLKPSLYPLTLTFFDCSASLSSRALERVLALKNGRTDTDAAALAAYLIYADLYGAGDVYAREIATLSETLSGVSGGYRIYSYAEEDPVMTAKICLLLGEQLSYSARENLASYLTRVVTDTAQGRECTAALMGLAALGRPVLGDLAYAWANADTICQEDDVARLQLAAAFAVLGDTTRAAEIYTDVAARLRVQDGEEIRFRRPDGTESLEDTLELSYAALLCASLTDPAEAAGLMTYLSARTSAYETYALETAIFAAAYAPAPTEEKSFTYILDGEVHTVTLRGRRPHTVTLHRDSHAGFAVTAAHEDIRVRAVYTGTPHEACAAVTPDVSVKKTVTPSDAGTGFYQVTVTVTGKTDRDFYMASLTDRIPTGARFVRMTGQNFSGSAHTYGHLYESGGTVYGSLYVSNPAKATTAGRSEKSFTATYSYLIRAYTAGKFVCESAYLTEAGEGRYALSQRHTVTFD